MAKKAPEPHHRFEAVGWIFFIVVSFILSIPLCYLIWQIRDEDTEAYAVVGMAVVCASIAAGFVTWIVNSMLQFRSKRRRLREKKTKRIERAPRVRQD